MRACWVSIKHVFVVSCNPIILMTCQSDGSYRMPIIQSDKSTAAGILHSYPHIPSAFQRLLTSILALILRRTFQVMLAGVEGKKRPWKNGEESAGDPPPSKKRKRGKLNSGEFSEDECPQCGNKLRNSGVCWKPGVCRKCRHVHVFQPAWWED